MSIAKNFIYNSAITLSSYIVGFIVFPYISRVLGVDSLGIVGFVDNVINYFIMFAMFGVETVGIREIAACRNDKERCSKVFFNLFTFVITSISIIACIYLIAIFIFPQLSRYNTFFLIGIAKLLFTPLLFEWLFIGNQDFRYISIRTIFVKILYLISIFIFVREKDDVDIYFLLTSISVIINSAINIFASRRYISWKCFSFKVGKYLPQIFKLGVFTFIISLYSTFNYVYLGVVSSEKQVGLYFTAIKLYTVIMGFFRAFTAVVLPKMSELVANKDYQNFQRIIDKSLSALFTFSIPTIIITSMLASFIIKIIAGEGYEDAALPMMIIMPILIIAGLNQINGVQIFMPLHKDNVLLVTASFAAAVGILCNIYLDAKYGAIGAACTILFSETVGCIGGLIYITKKKIYRFPFKTLLLHLLMATPCFAIMWIVDKFIENFYYKNISFGVLCLIYFSISNIFLLKNEIILNLMSKFKNKVVIWK